MIDLHRLNDMAFARLIGFQFQRASEGMSLVSLEVTLAHENLQGAAHGGILPIIIDAAGTTAIWSRVPEAAVLTADLRTSYIAAARPGQTIKAIGELTYLGTSTAYARVQVTGFQDAVLAIGQLTCVVKGRR